MGSGTTKVPCRNGHTTPVLVVLRAIAQQELYERIPQTCISSGANGSTKVLRQQQDLEKLAGVAAAASTRSNKQLPLPPQRYMLQILADLRDLEQLADPDDFQKRLLLHEDEGTRLLDGIVDPARLRATEAVISEFVPPVKGGDLTRRSAQLQARK